LSAAPTGVAQRLRAAWQRARELPDRWLFGPESRGADVGGRLRRIARFPYALLRDLAGGQLTLHAMSLVYATLLSVIPLLALSFAILATLHAQDLLQPLVQEFFAPMGAASGQLTARVMQYARNVHGGLVGTLGLGFLIWTLIGTMRKVEDGVNYVWRVQVARGFARRSADYVTMLIAGPLLLAVVAVFSRLAADSPPLRLLAGLPLIGRVDAFSLRVAPYVLVSVLLTMLYVAIPNTRVRVRPALIGGIAAGILWAAVGRYFTVFVLFSAHLTLIYAGFAITIAALLWTYFGWMILLLGALLSFYAQNPGYLREGLDEPRLSAALLERLALAIMVLVAGRTRDGLPTCSPAALALHLEAPAFAVARLCDALVAAGCLECAPDRSLRLARPAAELRPLGILRTLRAQGSDSLRIAPAIPAAVDDLCEQLELPRTQQLAELTLSDLIGQAR
jgi:membrane protein